MKQAFLAGLLGGLVVFAGGAVSWMVLPWHAGSLHTLPDGEIANRMGAQGLGSGVYCYPGLPPAGASETEKTAIFEKYRQGPRITMMVFRRDGEDCMSPTKYVAGLCVNLIAAWLVAALLAAVSGSLPRYGQRVGFVMALGVFAALVSHGESWLWWSYPSDFGVLGAIDLGAGWLLGGLVMAGIVRPRG